MKATLRQMVPRSVRMAASAFLARRRSAQLRRELIALGARPGIVIVGPWLGEVGFELLYWVPFVRWCAEQIGLEPERFVVISRGGTASWYQPFAARYADVFVEVSTDEFRDQHHARVRDLGEQKQTRITAFDQLLIDATVRRLGIRTWSVLHPSRMYETLNPYWWGHQPVEWVHQHTRYTTLAAPDGSGLLDLPPRYVATKFYFNDCFPDTPENRAFVRNTLRALARKGPVVALSTALNIDDHRGERFEQPGVSHLPEGIDPSRNLELQSEVVAGATSFVGTYGGFSYLAPFYRVPCRAFYSDRAGFSEKHLQMARSAFREIGVGALLDVRNASIGEVVDTAWAEGA